MKDKLKQIIAQLERINRQLEEQDKCGPIPFIEEAIERIDDAIEDLDTY